LNKLLTDIFVIDDEGTSIGFTPCRDGSYAEANTVGAIRHVDLLILRGDSHGKETRRHKTVWSTGGRGAEVISFSVEDLMQGIRLPLRDGKACCSVLY